MKLKLKYWLFYMALPISIWAQNKKAIDFTGGARFVMNNSQIGVQDTLVDSTTVKRNTGGYAILDLGVDIRPNKNTEIMGMFRIRNNYGGFWGAGVTFDVRQLWLKGVIGNIVRYQVGDLNLKQTPFTLYNHHADAIDSLPDVFKLQNQIINYDKFYFNNNTWRQQGANVDFGLTFSKFIKEINVDAFLTRLQATNFSTIPDRLMGGYSVDVLPTNNFSVGVNVFSVFDVNGTILDSNIYTNKVQSIDFKYKHLMHKNPLKIEGEFGKSKSEQSQKVIQSELKDYFAHAYTEYQMQKNHINLGLGYLNVGPEYRSIGAQSKDVNYNALSGFYSRYTNDQILRPLSLIDLASNLNIYNTSVSSNLMTINSVFNNVLPYGIATFNRNGVYAKANYKNKGISIQAEQYNLSEIKGQGTLKLKNFSLTKIQTQWALNKWLNTKNKFDVQVGANLQNTNRKGATSIEDVSLKSNLFQFGINYEFAPNFDVLGGLIFQKAKGNEFKEDRDEFSKVNYFTNQNYNLKQQLGALGLRYRFTEKIHLTALYQKNNYSDLSKVVADYNINQFALIFNMTY